MAEAVGTKDVLLSEGRLLTTMTLVLILLVMGSVFFSSWDVTIGLILGGALSYLNYFWLKQSLKSLFNQAATDKRTKFSASFYIFRYFVIALVVFLAATLRIASVAAMLVGLLSFAFAVLLEAIIQLYLAIVNREEN